MTMKELIKKLGLTEEQEKTAESAISEYVKSQTKETEASMQKRINALTKEKHEQKEEISKLTADIEVAKSQETKLSKRAEELEAKAKELETHKQEIIKGKRDKMSKIVKRLEAVKDTDPAFDKVSKLKEDLVLKEKLEDLTEAEIDTNLKTFALAEKYGAIEPEPANKDSPNVPGSEGQSSGYDGPVSEALKKK